MKMLRSGLVTAVCMVIVWFTATHAPAWVQWVVIIPACAVYGWSSRDFIDAAVMAIKSWKAGGNAA